MIARTHKALTRATSNGHWPETLSQTKTVYMAKCKGCGQTIKVTERQATGQALHSLCNATLQWKGKL